MPRPIPLVSEILANENRPDGTVVTRGSTYDNTENLASTFLRKMRERYEGTRLGRQELRAELLTDVPGALWTQKMLDRRTSENPKGAGLPLGYKLPDMARVCIGVDPSGTSGEDDDKSNDVGIIAVGLGVDGKCYVLEDYTCALGPAGWGKRVIYAYEAHKADRVVGEQNYGGAMVEFTIRTVKRNVSYEYVHATRGKVVRAEPVSALYEQGKVMHVGNLAALQDQMMQMTPSGYTGRGSPDRVDALVWAITYLMFGQQNGAGTSAAKGAH